MKKLISLLLITTIALFGCSSNSDSNVTPDDNAGTISCTINGKSWTSTKTLDAASNKFQKVFVGQNFTEKNGIGFNLDIANIKVGKTIIYDRTNVYEGIEYRTIDASGFPVDIFFGVGKLTITNATSAVVEGTFAFEAKNASVTNGKFSLRNTPW